VFPSARQKEITVEFVRHIKHHTVYITDVTARRIIIRAFD
jgi:hypothetical protein